jgi:hypothetical protein
LIFPISILLFDTVQMNRFRLQIDWRYRVAMVLRKCIRHLSLFDENHLDQKLAISNLFRHFVHLSTLQGWFQM